MKEKLIVLGAGGHSKVILDILLNNDEYDVVGIIDNSVTGEIMGVPIIGKDEDLSIFFEKGIKKAFVGIGNNFLRELLTKNLENKGYELVNVISEYAHISRYAVLGNGIAVMPGAIINSGTTIFKGTIINTNTSIDHDGNIGEFCHIAPGCSISGSVNIGNFTFVGTGVSIIDNISIGSNVMIGSGAAVVKNIDSNCTAVGVPAKVINEKTKF